MGMVLLSQDMPRLNSVAEKGEWILSVVELDGAYPLRILVRDDETIAQVKDFLCETERKTPLYVDEFDLILRRDIPYPLCLQMKLGDLLEEHRMLFVMHHPHAPTHSLPMRYTHPNGFDFSCIRETDIPFVDRWVSLLPSAEWIRLNTDLPWTHALLLSIGENVRWLSSLQCIEWEGKDACSEGFAYVRYHLAMDSYRSTEVIIKKIETRGTGDLNGGKDL